ncbi:5'-Nucleotidase/apyrase like protein [Aduncisulcus paluster]|uniref:5'-Nucleotidase/apyrase like protein n=1 Tax=Aduncisulcus paluster TaxID=2918883 RepID=A0ABQ5K2U3_9EUKA|nr:5'-Nucleotidase/apyrase like protein [Aduncisulcus paluster]
MGRFIIILIYFLAIFICFTAVSSSTISIAIAHTNDVHSHVDESYADASVCDLDDREDPDCYGSFSRLAGFYSKWSENLADGVIPFLFDAGDMFTGTSYDTIANGAVTVEFFSDLPYDVGTLGNHEFDLPINTLHDYILQLPFPIVNCNISFPNDNPLIEVVPQYHIIPDRDGHVFGVTGVAPPDLDEVAILPDGTVMLDSVESVKNAVANMKAEISANPDNFAEPFLSGIILLSHSGYEYDVDTLSPGLYGVVDVIIGGHSHTFLGDCSQSQDLPGGDECGGPYPTWNNPDTDVPVTQAYWAGLYVGSISLTITTDETELNGTLGGNDVITNHQTTIAEGQLNLLSIYLEEEYPADPTIEAELVEMREESDNLLEQKVCESEYYLDGENARGQETNLGDITADAMIWQAFNISSEITHINIQRLRQSIKYGNDVLVRTFDDIPVPDCGILNGGGIRASMEAGTVTRGDIMTVFPFQSSVGVLQEVSGSDLIEAIKHGLTGSNYTDGTVIVDHNGRMLQTSGLYYEYSKTKIDDDTDDIELLALSNCVIYNTGNTSCVDIDPNSTYNIATSSYLAQGGDGYEMFEKYPFFTTCSDTSTTFSAYGEYMESFDVPQVGLGRIVPETFIPQNNSTSWIVWVVLGCFVVVIGILGFLTYWSRMNDNHDSTKERSPMNGISIFDNSTLNGDIVTQEILI